VSRDPVDKATVRALAALSGAPYTQCLAAVHVLAPLQRHVDLGDLAAVLRGDEDRRVIGVRVDDDDLHRLRRTLPLADWAAHVVLVDRRPVSETRLLIPLAADATVLYDHVLDGPLLPRGPWRLPLRDVATAVEDLGPRGAHGAATMVLRVERCTLAPPPDGAVGSGVDEPVPAAIADLVAALDARGQRCRSRAVFRSPTDRWRGTTVAGADRLWWWDVSDRG
jgi:hypothetical protein